MVHSTERLILRPIGDGDFEHVFIGLSDPEVIRYYGVRYHSRKTALEQMQWFADLVANRTGIWWALCTAEHKTFIGAAGLNNLDRTNGKAEIGFWLLPNYWGKGYASEAIGAIVAHAFEAMSLHRLEAHVETENVRSRRTLEKTGFQYEATLRDCEMKDGKFISLDILSLLRVDSD